MFKRPFMPVYAFLLLVLLTQSCAAQRSVSDKTQTQSGLNIGEENPAFDPQHAWADRGVTDCCPAFHSIPPQKADAPEGNTIVATTKGNSTAAGPDAGRGAGAQPHRQRPSRRRSGYVGGRENAFQQQAVGG